MTQITDDSLEILGDMSSLEELEFFETKGVTDAGLAHLAKLSHLRRVTLTGLSNISWEGTNAFPDYVRVNYQV